MFHFLVGECCRWHEGRFFVVVVVVGFFCMWSLWVFFFFSLSFSSAWFSFLCCAEVWIALERCCRTVTTCAAFCPTPLTPVTCCQARFWSSAKKRLVTKEECTCSCDCCQFLRICHPHEEEVFILHECTCQRSWSHDCLYDVMRWGDSQVW